MNSGMPARAAVWAAMRTGATTAGAAMLASAAVRNRSDIDSAQAPYVPILLSRMISSLRSRVVPAERVGHVGEAIFMQASRSRSVSPRPSNQRRQ
jgi:hypothetical protein